MQNWTMKENKSAPQHLLGGRWPTTRHSFYASLDGFIMKTSYIDTHLSHVLHSVIGWIRTSSHQLDIEIVRYERKSKEEQICQLCIMG